MMCLRSCFKTAGDCPDFAESSEQNGTVRTVPLSDAVLKQLLRKSHWFACLWASLSCLAAGAAPTMFPGQRTADELRQDGFTPLVDGSSLAEWDVKPWHAGHWVARDGVIDYDGHLPRKKGRTPRCGPGGRSAIASCTSSGGCRPNRK